MGTNWTAPVRLANSNNFLPLYTPSAIPTNTSNSSSRATFLSDNSTSSFGTYPIDTPSMVNIYIVSPLPSPAEKPVTSMPPTSYDPGPATTTCPSGNWRV